MNSDLLEIIIKKIKLEVNIYATIIIFTSRITKKSPSVTDDRHHLTPRPKEDETIDVRLCCNLNTVGSDSFLKLLHCNLVNICKC